MNIIWNNLFNKLQVNLFLLLKKGPLFRGFNKSDLISIIKYFHTRKFSANEILFCDTSPSQSLFFIKSGKIKIYNEAHNNLNNSIILKPGDFFNELAFVDKPIEKIVAVAEKDSEVLMLLKSDFSLIIERKPNLAVKLLQNLAFILKERLMAALKKQHVE